VSFTHKKCLGVSVDSYELNAAKASVNHAVKGVYATAADADNFDYRQVVLIQTHDVPPHSLLLLSQLGHETKG
jgi:hypothetical protein